MEVVDKVQSEDNGGKDAVASMIKRLSHRNANVQLFTLELANTLGLNCETKINRELASRAFTDALLRLANDRNTHTTVKAKILERMAAWTETFKKDPDLGIMEGQYNKLKSLNPNLHPPSAPSKSRLTDLDRQKEEEELQMALKLSIQDKSAQQAKTAQAVPSNAGTSELPTATTSQPTLSGSTPATISRVRALFDFVPTEEGELEFRKGDIIAVLESAYKDWWKGSLRGQIGIFPLNYVEKLTDPTAEDKERAARMEAEVFGETKNVEKMLTLISSLNTSSGDVRHEEELAELNDLYQRAIRIRPTVVELLGKYSQAKDDYTDLNEKYIRACRDYEALLDASMSQSHQTYQYGRPQHGYGGGYHPQNAPPQQDPARYYTPGPSGQQKQQPYPQTPSSTGNLPPRNGPAPFYLVAGQGQPPHASQPGYPQQAQQGRQPGYPQRDPTPRLPSGATATPLRTNNTPPNSQYSPMQAQSGHRPQSTYENPQELAATTYDSATGQASNNQYPDEQQFGASVYREEPHPVDGNSSHNAIPHPPQQYNATPSSHNIPPPQKQYTAYAPSQHQQHPSQPSYEPPPPPQSSAPTPPVSVGGPGYPVLDPRQTNSTQNQGPYKAYQRPTEPGTPNPADFYRQAN